MVLKPPPDGAKSTFRVSSLESLLRAGAGDGACAERPVLAEEMLRGEELSFETLTVGGVPRAHSISQYFPSCLEVLENPWIQWVCFFRATCRGGVRRARAPRVRRDQGARLDNGVTHMEWFRRENGRLAIGEIAQRPPGATSRG